MKSLLIYALGLIVASQVECGESLGLFSFIEETPSLSDQAEVADTIKREYNFISNEITRNKRLSPQNATRLLNINAFFASLEWSATINPSEETEAPSKPGESKVLVAGQEDGTEPQKKEIIDPINPEVEKKESPAHTKEDILRKRSVYFDFYLKNLTSLEHDADLSLVAKKRYKIYKSLAKAYGKTAMDYKSASIVIGSIIAKKYEGKLDMNMIVRRVHQINAGTSQQLIKFLSLAEIPDILGAEFTKIYKIPDEYPSPPKHNSKPRFVSDIPMRVLNDAAIISRRERSIRRKIHRSR
jgi:hypothetical protein